MNSTSSKGYTTLEVICSLILFAFVAASIAIILPMAYQNMSSWRERLNLSRYLEAHLEENRSKTYDEISIGDTGYVAETLSNGATYQYRQQTIRVEEGINSESKPTWVESDANISENPVKKTIINVINPLTMQKLSGFLLTFPKQVVEVPSIKLSILYKCNFKKSTSNTIGPWFWIANDDTESLDLSTLKIRYWFTADNHPAQTFTCDWAGMEKGYNMLHITDKITNSFRQLNPSVTNTDRYVEIGFASGLQTLDPGKHTEVQTRIYDSNNQWQDYNQANDYSFDSSMSQKYAENTKITVYVNGKLIFGTEPN